MCNGESVVLMSVNVSVRGRFFAIGQLHAVSSALGPAIDDDKTLNRGLAMAQTLLRPFRSPGGFGYPRALHQFSMTPERQIPCLDNGMLTMCL